MAVNERVIIKYLHMYAMSSVVRGDKFT